MKPRDTRGGLFEIILYYVGELEDALSIGSLDPIPHAVHFWHCRERPSVRFFDISNWGTSSIYVPKRPFKQKEWRNKKN